MKIAVYQSVKRTPTLLSDRSSGFDDITGASYGVDDLLVKILIDLVPKSAYQHIHHVRLGVKIVFPDVFEDHGLGNDFA